MRLRGRLCSLQPAHTVLLLPFCWEISDRSHRPHLLHSATGLSPPPYAKHQRRGGALWDAPLPPIPREVGTNGDTLSRGVTQDAHAHLWCPMWQDAPEMLLLGSEVVLMESYWGNPGLVSTDCSSNTSMPKPACLRYQAILLGARGDQSLCIRASCSPSPPVYHHHPIEKITQCHVTELTVWHSCPPAYMCAHDSGPALQGAG